MWCYDLRQQWGLSTANRWLSNTCYILLSLLQTEHYIYMNKSANIFKLWLYLRGSCATGRFQKGQDGFAVSGTTMSMVPGCCRSVLTVALKCSTMKLTQTDRKTHVRTCTHTYTYTYACTHTEPDIYHFLCTYASALHRDTSMALVGLQPPVSWCSWLICVKWSKGNVFDAAANWSVQCVLC